jgi:hypothetical protein
MTVIEAAHQLEISEQTYYLWRKEYGGLDTTQTRKLKEIEKENLQLKKLLSDLSIENDYPKSIYFACCHFRAISNSPLYWTARPGVKGIHFF